MTTKPKNTLLGDVLPKRVLSFVPAGGSTNFSNAGRITVWEEPVT